MYRLNPDDIGHEQYQNRLDNIKRWKYEVRFLRAYFYFELIKRNGGVPVITRPVEIGDSFPRNTLDSCVNFIVKECDDIAWGLPVKYTEQENLGHYPFYRLLSPSVCKMVTFHHSLTPHYIMLHNQSS